jgi:hypothetical protein
VLINQAHEVDRLREQLRRESSQHQELREAVRERQEAA